MIVEEPVLDQFTRLLVERTKRIRVGNGAEEGVEMGPAASEENMSTATSWSLQSSRMSTQICGLRTKRSLARLCVISGKDSNRALELANDAQYRFSRSSSHFLVRPGIVAHNIWHIIGLSN
jgi:hypothetical protein